MAEDDPHLDPTNVPADPPDDDPPADPEPADPPEPDKRLSALEKGISEERRKRQLAEQELARYRQQPRQEPRQEPRGEVDVDSAVERAIAQRERERRIEAWQGTKTQAAERLKGVDLDAAVDSVGGALARYGEAGLEIADQIMSSDKSWDVIAHLNANPEELARLSRMGPAKAAYEIGKIESRLGTPSQKVSGAPDPIKPIGSRVQADKDPDDMSLAEYEEHVRKQRGGSVWPR